MAGIYFHIPFCKQACTYCNFHFTTSLRFKDDMVRAMTEEVRAETAYLQNKTIDTIYFGGGTPSLLAPADITLLLQTVRNHYPVAADAEITLEANPDDIHEERLHQWKNSGINRLSIGVQSFLEEELQWMNRAHNSEQALSSLQLATKEFDNITLDLIYGTPLLTDVLWKEQVDQATALGIRHLSCYALTVEEKTALHKKIRLQQSADVDADKQARQFLLLMSWMREKGFEHYEVSNFALPGFRSRHNSSYWKGESYLGIGPSAHSFNGEERSWNVANNTLYLRGLQEGKPQRELEVLTPVQQLNEYIMISLRTREGMDLERIGQEFGISEKKRTEQGLIKFARNGLLLVKDNRAALTDEGMLMADGIASDLFLTAS